MRNIEVGDLEAITPSPRPTRTPVSSIDVDTDADESMIIVICFIVGGFCCFIILIARRSYTNQQAIGTTNAKWLTTVVLLPKLRVSWINSNRNFWDRQCQRQD